MKILINLIKVSPTLKDEYPNFINDLAFNNEFQSTL